MKKYFLNAATLTILLFVTGCTIQVERKVIHIVNPPFELSATTRIPDLHDSLKIMQITDSHISIEDEKESDFMVYGERMRKAYMNPRKHFSLDTSITTFDNLDNILLKAKSENIDLLILTGDIVNFPSPASVNYVYERLKRTGIQWLFISGNHDWHYEGMEGTLDSLRNTWIDKSLLPLYNGHNPLYFSTVIHGINFVGIDNSTGQVNEKQVEFLQDQLKKKEPIILMSHIPYKLNTPEMSAITEIIVENSNKIVAILAGHIHKPSYFFTGNLCQYTSIAAFQGGSFTLNIKPKQPLPR
ncbi:MAG TPA: metallophosphoesterase [Bacteroidales bacterium]|nr:metallophosphoesterase [Bacteroidales bacterium]